MVETALWAIGLPVAYLLVGLTVGRACYTYWINNRVFQSQIDDVPLFFSTLLVVLLWPLGGVAFGSYYFVTNGVRKQNKESIAA